MNAYVAVKGSRVLATCPADCPAAARWCPDPDQALGHVTDQVAPAQRHPTWAICWPQLRRHCLPARYRGFLQRPSLLRLAALQLLL